MAWVPAHTVTSPEWEEIAENLPRGLVMVLGAPNMGKSTFARWLFAQAHSTGSGPVGFLDGDPGQSSLGPPTTLTLAIAEQGKPISMVTGEIWRRFLGSTTPRGHMLTHVVAIARLVQIARSQGIETIIYDTSGLINPAHGGVRLKLAKLDLLRPNTVIAIQRDQELMQVLEFLRRSKKLKLFELGTSPLVQAPSVTARRYHRAKQFARYFSEASILEIDIGHYALVSELVDSPNQLLAFEDADGFTLGLGIMIEPGNHAKVLTPLNDTAAVDVLHFGDLLLDPQTWHGAQIYH